MYDFWVEFLNLRSVSCSKQKYKRKVKIDNVYNKGLVEK